jgi:hypothetical protein
MSTSESFQALRRANPRAKAEFMQAVEAAVEPFRERDMTSASAPRRRRSVGRIPAAGVSLAAAAAVVVWLTVASTGGGPAVGNAAAAVKTAAAVTAASAERSGTAIVRITHDGELWAGTTIRWRDGDLAVSQDTPGRHGKAGAELLLVDGKLYGIDPEVEGGWIELGSPSSIDPDSGTTPAEYLAAVREDVGGVTLRRIADGVTGLTTTRHGDGSTVYGGTVAAGLIARETGFKGSTPIRVLPFGYVAHDEAADPDAPLDAAVTVGADGLVRQIAVTWGAGASPWSYTVKYRNLGATAGPAAPANARSLLKERRQGG